MGGRGASSGLKSANSSGGGGENQPFQVPKFSESELKGLSRSSLENIAAAIFANQGLKSGLSISDGVHRAKSLMSGNTSAQLRKYILKNNK